MRVEGAGVVLRPLAAADERAYCDIVGDPDVRAYLGGPVANPEERFRGDLDAGPRAGIWAVERNGLDRAVGLISLSKHKDGVDVELSYQFSPGVWGQGVAFAACQLVLARLAPRLALDRVIAETQVANARSVRLLERLGFSVFDEVERFGATQVLMERQL